MLIKPRAPTGLPHFSARFGSARGLIEVAWNWNGAAAAADGTRAITLNVVVPPNVRADIHVPSAAGTTIVERDDRGVAVGPPIAAATAGGATATVLVRGSGTYSFSSVVRV